MTKRRRLELEMDDDGVFVEAMLVSPSRKRSCYKEVGHWALPHEVIMVVCMKKRRHVLHVLLTSPCPLDWLLSDSRRPGQDRQCAL